MLGVPPASLFVPVDQPALADEMSRLPLRVYV